MSMRHTQTTAAQTFDRDYNAYLAQQAVESLKRDGVPPLPVETDDRKGWRDMTTREAFAFIFARLREGSRDPMGDMMGRNF